MTELVALKERVRTEATRTVVGMERTVDDLLVALLAGGHVLIEGVPGVAKTLLARTLARILSGGFSRIQFTPDLMPSDVTGTSVYDMETRAFRVRRGPVFANVVLADEINRAPAKTQSALLEAMQERQVSIDGVSHPLPRPHVVLATENPVEYEGTYPLPEAALDRFFFRVVMGYPEHERECEVLARHRDGIHAAEDALETVQAVLDGEALEAARADLARVRMDDDLVRYVVDLARATREDPDCRLGASPRAAIVLMTAARTRAALEGRDHAWPDDIQAALEPAWAHRIVLEPGPELDGLLPADFLERILRSVPVPR